jgi:di/tricarboxylate transporter
LPPLPDLHALIVIALTGVTLFLFTKDRIPLETTGLSVMLLLILLFYFFPYKDVSPADFLANFGNEALVTVCALLVVGRGLETTGALQPLGNVMARYWSDSPKLALFLTLLSGALFSAFLNNTPIVVMLLPVLVACSLRSRTPPSGVLMPMGLATLVGGMATTIGTSTNLLVVGIAADLGQRRFEMFDFTLPVVIAGSVGLLFLWLVAPRLLPDRKPPMLDTSPRLFNAMLTVNEDSYANGKTLSEILARTENRMRVDRIQRTESLFVAKLPSVKLQAGDRLYVRDSSDRLKEFEQLLGATLYGEDDAERPITDDKPFDTSGSADWRRSSSPGVRRCITVPSTRRSSLRDTGWRRWPCIGRVPAAIWRAT